MWKWLLIVFILLFSQNVYGQEDISTYPIVDNMKFQEIEDPSNPVAIKLDKVRQFSIASYVEFTLRNNCDENIKAVRLIFYLFDNNSNFKKVNHYSSQLLNLIPHTNQSVTAFVEQEVESKDRLIVVIEKITTDKGKWLVKEFGAEVNDFSKVYDKHFKEKLELSKIVEYYTNTALIREDNIVLSNEDRKEIYQTSIKEFLEDDNVKKLFKPRKHNPIILFFDEGVEIFNLQQYKFVNLTAKQIQGKANRLGLIKYLHVKTIYIEGNSCEISVNYELARKGYEFHSDCCCCYTFSFYLKKEQDKWTIKGGLGGYL